MQTERQKVRFCSGLWPHGRLAGNSSGLSHGWRYISISPEPNLFGCDDLDELDNIYVSWGYEKTRWKCCQHWRYCKSNNHKISSSPLRKRTWRKSQKVVYVTNTDLAGSFFWSIFKSSLSFQHVRITGKKLVTSLVGINSLGMKYLNTLESLVTTPKMHPV